MHKTSAIAAMMAVLLLPSSPHAAGPVWRSTTLWGIEPPVTAEPVGPREPESQRVESEPLEADPRAVTIEPEIEPPSPDTPVPSTGAADEEGEARAEMAASPLSDGVVRRRDDVWISSTLVRAGIGVGVLGVAFSAATVAALVLGNTYEQQLGLHDGTFEPGESTDDHSAAEELADDERKRRALLDKGELVNRLVLPFAITAGALLTTGAVLLGLGLRRRQDTRRAAVTPAMGPDGAGIVVQGRF